MNRSKYLHTLLFFLYIIFFVSMVCALRAVTSISIGSILLVSLFKNKVDNGVALTRNFKSIFFKSCCVFYLLQCLSLLYTHDLKESTRHLQLKSGLIFIPFALCCSNYINERFRDKLMRYYILIIASALFYCLAIAFHQYYFFNTSTDVFFYHKLVSPFSQHAVQVSILVFIGLLYLMESAKKRYFFLNRFVHLCMTAYLGLLIILLSSKLVIVFSVCVFIYYSAISFKKNTSGRLITLASTFVCLATITVILSTNNPISSRFREIISGNNAIVQQEHFDPGIYFNGLQFRLLEWRFVKEILTENKAWLIGVSPGDAQGLLNKKYISTHMYIGDKESADQGFLGYNTHNQFLESVLQTGLLGLLAFILICLGMIRLAMERKSRELSFLVILLLCYAFNESIFETQYGLALFTFFPLFLYYGTLPKPPGFQ